MSILLLSLRRTPGQAAGIYLPRNASLSSCTQEASASTWSATKLPDSDVLRRGHSICQRPKKINVV